MNLLSACVVVVIARISDDGLRELTWLGLDGTFALLLRGVLFYPLVWTRRLGVCAFHRTSLSLIVGLSFCIFVVRMALGRGGIVVCSLIGRVFVRLAGAPTFMRAHRAFAACARVCAINRRRVSTTPSHPLPAVNIVFVNDGRLSSFTPTPHLPTTLTRLLPFLCVLCARRRTHTHALRTLCAHNTFTCHHTYATIFTHTRINGTRGTRIIIVGISSIVAWMGLVTRTPRKIIIGDEWWIGGSSDVRRHRFFTPCAVSTYHAHHAHRHRDQSSDRDGRTSIMVNARGENNAAAAAAHFCNALPLAAHGRE